MSWKDTVADYAWKHAWNEHCRNVPIEVRDGHTSPVVSHRHYVTKYSSSNKGTYILVGKKWLAENLKPEELAEYVAEERLLK